VIFTYNLTISENIKAENIKVGSTGGSLGDTPLFGAKERGGGADDE